jgi:hypothetical protein
LRFNHTEARGSPLITLGGLERKRVMFFWAHILDARSRSTPRLPGFHLALNDLQWRHTHIEWGAKNDRVIIGDDLKIGDFS